MSPVGLRYEQGTAAGLKGVRKIALCAGRDSPGCAVRSPKQYPAEQSSPSLVFANLCD
jgi:hypothetical protein